jgi:hypothetical protein
LDVGERPVKQRIRRAVVLAAVVIGLATLLFTPQANASCIAIPSLQEAVANAKFAFVGKVVATSNRGRTARVRIDSVWKGTRIPRHVVVRGSPASGNSVTTVDREYVKNRKYLFVPYQRKSHSTFLDNECSATSEYTAAIAGDAPSTTR